MCLGRSSNLALSTLVHFCVNRVDELDVVIDKVQVGSIFLQKRKEMLLCRHNRRIDAAIVSFAE